MRFSWLPVLAFLAVSCGTSTPEVDTEMDGGRPVVVPEPEQPTTELTRVQLYVEGAGAGTVRIEPSGTDCTGHCELTMPRGELLELTATASDGSRFEGWDGACGGTGQCVVPLADPEVEVTARFGLLRSFTVEVTKTGPASGTVRSADGLLDCGDSCQATYFENEEVELLAQPDEGAHFAGWEGSCSGTGACRLRVVEARTVVARFIRTWTLEVAVRGPGVGAVVSSKPFFRCTGQCSISVPEGTPLVLEAVPDQDSSFRGFAGACMEEGPCSITMHGPHALEARFVPAHLWSVNFRSLIAEGWVLPSGTSTAPNGDVVVAGMFSSSMSVGGGGPVLTAAGYPNSASSDAGDVFVSRFDRTGAHLWTRQFGGTANDAGMSVATDSRGNAYVLVLTRGDIDFGAGIITHRNPGSPSGAQNFVLVKLDPDGNFLGQLSSDTAHHFDPSSGGQPSIAIGPLDEVFIGVSFLGTLTFDGVSTVSSGAYSAHALFRLEPDLTVRWAVSAPGTGGHSLAVDAAGVIAGATAIAFGQDAGDFGCGPATVHPTLLRNGLITQLSHQGACMDARSIIEPVSAGTGQNTFAMRGAGGVYVAVFYTHGWVSFDGQTFPIENGDLLLASLEPAEGVGRWVKRIHSFAPDLPEGLIVDSSGALVLASSFARDLRVDGQLVHSRGYALSSFLARWSPRDGRMLSSRSYTSAGDLHQITHLSQGPDDALLITGTHTGTDFGGGPLPHGWPHHHSGFVAVVNP